MRPRDNGQFAPEESVSRAEAAGALYAALSAEVLHRERESINAPHTNSDDRDRSPVEPPVHPTPKLR